MIIKFGAAKLFFTGPNYILKYTVWKIVRLDQTLLCIWDFYTLKQVQKIIQVFQNVKSQEL